MSKPEKLSHYAVVIIALTAVFVSFWQGRISQKQLELSIQHNKLTVKPYIDITRFTNSSDQTFEVKLANEGYGPAIVKGFELIYENKSYNNWNSVLEAAGENGNILFLNNYGDGSVIASGKEEVLCRLRSSFEHKGITVKITYESIYEERNVEELTF